MLEIVKFGDDVLTTIARKIQDIDPRIKEIAQAMVHTMHQAPGIGLAAPQVNHSLQLITVDLSVGERKEDLIILVNPEILEKEGENISVEGCLSVPEIQEKISRPLRITIRGLNLDGKEQTYEAEGLLARVFCHEVDHIQGRLFIDHLSPLKRNLIRKKLRKQRNKGLF
jgi:peptide deformylase